MAKVHTYTLKQLFDNVTDKDVVEQQAENIANHLNTKIATLTSLSAPVELQPRSLRFRLKQPKGRATHKENNLELLIEFNPHPRRTDDITTTITYKPEKYQRAMEIAHVIVPLMLEYAPTRALDSHGIEIIQQYEPIKDKIKAAHQHSRIFSHLKTGLATATPPLNPQAKLIITENYWNKKESITLDKEKDINFTLKYLAHNILPDQLHLVVTYKPAQQVRAIEIVKTIAPILADYKPI